MLNILIVCCEVFLCCCPPCVVLIYFVLELVCGTPNAVDCGWITFDH